MKNIVPAAILAGIAFGPGAASAQDGARIMVESHEQYGDYLADGEGRALYLFTRDTQGAEGTDPTVACEGGCLAAWPPFYATGSAEAGDGIDESLVGSVEHDGQEMVTYNGWPLYYYASDAAAGDVTGQGANDVWYLVAPDGETIED